MDDTLIIGGSHAYSLYPIKKLYNNIKFAITEGLTLYGTLKKKDLIFNLIDSKYKNITIFKNVIIIVGYTDINSALLYLKYNKDKDWIKKTLLKSIHNFSKFIDIFRNKYPNKKIYLCNPILNPYINKKDISTYKLYQSILVNYLKNSNIIERKSIINKNLFLEYKNNTNFFKKTCAKYNINHDIINKIIEERKTYIPFFQRKIKSFSQKNNIVFLNLNPYLSKIKYKKCTSLWSDIDTRYYYDHHYIYELFTMCLLFTIKKHVYINPNILKKLYHEYKIFSQRKKNKVKNKNNKICNMKYIIN